MANIGEQLLKSETGYQRIDNTNASITYSGTWSNVTNPAYHSSSLTYTNDETAYYSFYFYGTKFYIIANDCDIYSKNIKVFLDDIETTGYELVNYVGGSESNLSLYKLRVLFSANNLEERVHKVVVKCTNKETTLSMSLDCIDIDSNGHMATEQEYLSQSQDEPSEFPIPIKLADETIESEDHIAEYAGTLVNGEKQLLISTKLKSFYVSDGQGGYTTINSSGSSINDITDSTTTTNSGTRINEKIESNKMDILNQVKNDYLDKTTFQSTENEGSVKLADKAKELDVHEQLTGNRQYYGVGDGDTNNTMKLRPFPTGTITERIDTYTYNNLTQNVSQSIDFVQEIPEVNCFSQAFEYESGEANVEDIFEKYSNDNITLKTKDVICTNDGLKIKDFYETTNNGQNENGFYKIKLSDFVSINNIISEVNE